MKEKLNPQIKGIFIKIIIVVVVLLLAISFVDATRRPIEALNPIEPENAELGIKGEAGVDLFSGSATYSYLIDIPPGTNGLQPNVGLFYNSQSAGRPGIVGRSWSLSTNYIQRDTNNTFEDGNISDDEFIINLNGVSDTLVYVQSEDKFHTKKESFLYVKNKSGGGNEQDQYWIVKTKDGTSYRFGYYNFSEASSNGYNYALRWYLDLVNDTYNNKIFYNYTENPYAKDVGATYLDLISYNNDVSRTIEFNYENENRPDIWGSSYNQSNQIVESRRLKEVVVNAGNSLVRRYFLEYNLLEAIGSVSFLSNITEFGNDNFTILPLTKFGYTDVIPSWGQVNISDVFTWPGCHNSSQGFKNYSDDLCLSAYSNKDEGVRLVDVNGDGLQDIVQSKGKASSKGIAEIFINTGTGWQNDTIWDYPSCNELDGSDVDCITTYHQSDNGIRFGDVNGDGYVDIVKAKAKSYLGRGKSNIWINSRNGSWTNETGWVYPWCNWNTDNSDITCFLSYDGKDNGARLVDINGDGYVDIIRAKGIMENPETPKGVNDIWINNRSGGWSNITGWKYPGCNWEIMGSDYSCIIDQDRLDNGVRFGDVNGDGLNDLLLARGKTNGNGTSDIWINNGTGWRNETGWVHPCKTNSSACFASYSGYDNAVRAIDLNHDGLLDFVKARQNTTSNAGFSDIWLNNGTGWTKSNIWLYPGCDKNNGSLCISDRNGADHGVSLSDINGDGLIDIIYARGTPQEAGISDVWISNGTHSYLMNEITSSLGGVISIDYQKSTDLNNSGDDKIEDLGFNTWVVSSIIYDNNIEGEHHLNITKIYNYSGGMYDGILDEFRGFNYVEEKVGNTRTKNWFHQSHELNGRKYQVEVLNLSDTPYQKSNKDWTFIEQNGYFVIELTQESEITQDGESDNPRIKNASYDYDDFGNLIFRHNKGDVNNPNDDKYEYFEYLNNSESWIVNKIMNSTLYNTDNSIKLKETFYSYDGLAFGEAPTNGSLTSRENWLDNGDNPTTSYSYNNFGNLIDETDANGQITQYVYGIRDTTNTFTDQAINSLEKPTDYNYDLGTGNLLSEADSNNITKNYTYDLFGIRETVILPLDNPTYPTQEYDYDFENVDEGWMFIKQREESSTAETLDVYRFYDGFGKLIQTKSEAINSKQIVTDIYYDEFGRIKEQSNPYLVSFEENYSTPDQSINKITYEYDNLGRVTNITNQDNTKKSISYDHWNITIYDEKGNKIDYEKDSYGNIIFVIEYNNTESYKTEYKYDGNNQLISVTDALSNDINYTYDSLGRKIGMIDPDMGAWSYTYDLVGNLIGQTDNRGIVLDMEHDELNRKTKDISEDDNVTYVYDLDKNNVLSQIIGPDYGINYTYDGRLRKITEEKIIGGIAFTTELTYDASDRVISQTLPSGESINLEYDNQGSLSSITEVLDINYNEKNSPLGISYNNSLVSNYTYNPTNFRLTNINTDNDQNLSYVYDLVGNVIEINDATNVRDFSMIYDDLNRLTYSIISDDTGNNVLSFFYNGIGNLLNVTGSQNAEFYYDNSLAHAPSKVTYY